MGWMCTFRYLVLEWISCILSHNCRDRMSCWKEDVGNEIRETILQRSSKPFSLLVALRWTLSSMSRFSCAGSELDPASRCVPPALTHRGLISSCDLLAEYSLPSTAQEAGGSLCHEDTVLAHGQLGVHQDSSLEDKATFQPVRPQ